MPLNTYRPDLMGSAYINVSDPVVCGSWQSIELIYTAGHFGIDDSGSIKICFRSASDQTRFQMTQPTAAGFVAIQTSNGAPVKTWFESNRNIRPWHHTLYIQCGRFLSEGDQIRVIFGDQSQGGPGFRTQTFAETSFEFRVHVDAFATYDYVMLPADQQPTMQLVPGPAARFRAILPTLRFVDDSFEFAIKAEDRWGNPTSLVDVELMLKPSRPVAGLPDSVKMRQCDGVLKIPNLRVAEAGQLWIDVVHDGEILAHSNVLVSSQSHPYRHYWSDMHGQSEETVGTNSAREYFTFARDKGLVDIIGHQGNDFQITDAFWDELNRLTAEFDQPGRFLAIPGYEWSGNTSVGGDHNVWYRTEGRPIYRAHRALVMEDSQPQHDCLDANALFSKLADEDALIVAHVGGRYADVKYAHSAKLEPSVEVHSAWGTFEWIVEEALSSGYRVGIVAASDGHKGRPGASYPGASKFGSYGGLTCHLLPELSRDALFAEFRQRHHYATTGCRPYLDIRLIGLQNATREIPTGVERVEEALMGDIIVCENTELTLQFEIAAQSGVERIEIRDGSSLLDCIRPHESSRDSGRRVRVQCEGAEYRGRGRLVSWDVSVEFSDATIERTSAYNFWNPDKPVDAQSSIAHWSNVTTGGTHCVDFWLNDPTEGDLTFSSQVATFTVPLRSLGTQDYRVDCGGLDKAVRIFRLPDDPLPAFFSETRSIKLHHHAERRLYLKVVFEDGHMAWTSPIFVRHPE